MSEAAEELFLFLEPGSDPAVDRQILEHDGGRTLLVWAPDADAAAEVADRAVQDGVRLIELYRGFDLGSASRVIETVVPRAPVAPASFGFGSAPTRNVRRSVTLFHSDEETPARVVRTHDDGWTAIVGAPLEKLGEVAEEFVAQGAELVEVCGGTPLSTAAQVHARVGDRVPVSQVSWPYESIDGAYAFKSAFLAEH